MPNGQWQILEKSVEQEQELEKARSLMNRLAAPAAFGAGMLAANYSPHIVYSLAQAGNEMYRHPSQDHQDPAERIKAPEIARAVNESIKAFGQAREEMPGGLAGAAVRSMTKDEVPKKKKKPKRNLT